MAPKTQSKKSDSQSVASSVAAPAPVEKKKAPSKKADKKAEVAAPAPVVEKKKAPSKKADKKSEVAAPVEADAVEVEQVERKRGVKREVNKESVNADFENMIAQINTEIDRLKELKPKVKGGKFLRTLTKGLKQLLSDTNRVTKFKKTTNRKSSNTSGFLRPVCISAELAKFTGWDASQNYSRTQVTKFICEYVKNNKLFDQSENGDKRNILCDAKLKNLLQVEKNPPRDPETGAILPLTYFRLQQYLKSHFSKPAEEVNDELQE